MNAREAALEISRRLVLDLSDDQIERAAQIIQAADTSRPTAPASADVVRVRTSLATLAHIHAHHAEPIGGAIDLISRQAAALTAALAEGERLNKWADGFDAAAMKERQLADVRIKELNARVVTLETALKPFSNAWKKGWRLNGLQSVQQYVGEDDYRGAFDAIEQR